MSAKNRYYLTVGVTICYKSSITKSRQAILSLFNNEMTCDKLANIDEYRSLKQKYNSDEFNEMNMDLIELNKPVQLIVVLDGNNRILWNSIKLLLNNLKRYYLNYLHCSIHFVNKHSVSVSRNKIINRAIGRYIKFCDDDDLSVNFNELLSIIQQNKHYD